MTTTKHVGKVLAMDYHRNGISGEGFWTIIFEHFAEPTEIFIATYFPNDEGECRTAVLRLADLNRNNASGTMRGDCFHDELKSLADNYEWPYERKERLAKEGPNRRAAIEHSRAQVSETLTEE